MKVQKFEFSFNCRYVGLLVELAEGIMRADPLPLTPTTAEVSPFSYCRDVYNCIARLFYIDLIWEDFYLRTF